MKHNYKITLILLTIFILAQFIGIGIIYNYIDHEQSTEDKTVFKELPIGERPPIDEKTSFIPILIAILLGTGLLLLLIKYKLNWVWKGWFLIAVVLSLTVAFGVFIGNRIALLVALILGFWKVFRPNVYIHNLTELFIYGGLAAIFVPIFDVLSASVLLVLISLYDAYAVWKSKHMITLAKSQTKARVFAGLMIPYKLLKKSKKKVKKTKKVMVKVKTAVLGGGDIAFPLIFAGVILKEWSLWQALIIPIFAALGLTIIFLKGNENKFYPAMPFISAGCFVGLLVVWLLGIVI